MRLGGKSACAAPIYAHASCYDRALSLRSGSTRTAGEQRHVYARVPGAAREVPIRRYRYETLRQIGWPLFRIARFVNWCGHEQELIPVPDDAGWVRLVPVIGTAK